jgi:hypothetical protein
MDPHVELDKLRKPTSADDLRRQVGRLKTHLEVLEETSFDVDFVELDLANRIVTQLTKAIDESATFDASQRTTLGAAIAYFILSADADHDLTSPRGLHDDARVANAAFALLGRPDLAIDVPGTH